MGLGFSDQCFASLCNWMTIEQIYREESGRILATLIRLLGDFDLAEEAQEAFAAALAQWPTEGIWQARVPGWFLRGETRRSIGCGGELASKRGARNWKGSPGSRTEWPKNRKNRC